MSEKGYKVPPESERISAEKLRDRMSDKAIAEAKDKAAKARALDEEKNKAYQEFMERRFTEDDRVQIQGKIEKAADQGLFEVEMLRFPSEYLEDHGRRINNDDQDWHEHLCGYAKECHDAFEDLSQPQGYRLIARVLNYPHGMIGDIALVVSWKG